MHPTIETAIMPDRDVMLGMSDDDFVGLWQRIVGERPAVLIARGDMVRILAELQDRSGDPITPRREAVAS